MNPEKRREEKDVLEKLSRFLNGQFKCVKCGRTYLTATFGYGKCICPGCYRGEFHFISYDRDFWLNRVLDSLSKFPRIMPYEDYEKLHRDIELIYEDTRLGA